MKEGPPDRSRRRFRIGVALIAASYPLWAAALLLGALQLRGGSFPWWLVGAALLVLNWAAFAAGIFLAGREAVGHVRRKAVQFIRKSREKKETPQSATGE